MYIRKLDENCILSDPEVYEILEIAILDHKILISLTYCPLWNVGKVEMIMQFYVGCVRVTASEWCGRARHCRL